jgi:hypothetical protein
MPKGGHSAAGGTNMVKVGSHVVKVTVHSKSGTQVRMMLAIQSPGPSKTIAVGVGTSIAQVVAAITGVVQGLNDAVEEQTLTAKDALDLILNSLAEKLPSYAAELGRKARNLKRTAEQAATFGSGLYNGFHPDQKTQLSTQGWTIVRGTPEDKLFMSKVQRLCVQAHAAPPWSTATAGATRPRGRGPAASLDTKSGKRIHNKKSNLTTVYLVNQDDHDYQTAAGRYAAHSKALKEIEPVYSLDCLKLCTGKDLKLLNEFKGWVQKAAGFSVPPTEVGSIASAAQQGGSDQESHQDSINLTLSCIVALGDDVTGTYFAPRAPILPAERLKSLKEVSIAAWEEWVRLGGEGCMKSCGQVNLGDRIYFQGFGIHKAPPSTELLRRSVFLAFEPVARTCDDVVIFASTYEEIWKNQAQALKKSRKIKSGVIRQVLKSVEEESQLGL